MSNNVDKFSAYLEAAKQQKNTPEQVLARQQQVFERDIAPKLPKEKVEQARQHWQSLTTPLIEKAGFIKFDQPDPKILNSKQYSDNLNKFYQSGIGLDAAKQQAYEQTRRDLTPEKGILGYGRDIGLSALRGAISVPEAAVGLVDIPTGGRIGKFLENEGGIIGFRPEAAKAALDDLHTDKYKLQQQDFANAPGLMGKLGVVADNPSLVVNPVVESLPLMGAGGVIGRGIMAVAPRVSGLAAGAAGEGAVSAGIQAEQIRSQTDDGHLSGKQSLLAATTGGVTGALSLGGAGLARRFGVADVDTMLASGMGSTAAMANKGIARRVAEGAVTEGLLEELPQSVSEQMQQNAALDKPLDQGVMDNAIIGTLSGAAMGGGFAGYAGMQRNSQVKQIKQAQTDLPNALTQAQAGLQAAQQAGDPTGLQAAQQQYDVVLEAVNATNAKASEYGINSHTPEFKNLIDSLGLSNPADPQPGDIGRVSDGQPFANKNAALNYQKKNGLADTHEIVRLGASPQFVLRDKNPVQPEPEPEQAQQELLGLPAPVYEVTPDGTVITTADRNAQVQQQHQDEADRLDRINRGEMRDVTPIPVSDTPIQPPTPGLAGVAERALQRDAEVSARKEVDFKELYTRARLNGDNETANQAIQDAFTSGIELPVLQQWRKDVEPQILAQQEQAYQNYLGQQPKLPEQQPVAEPEQLTPPATTVDQQPTPNTTADDIRNGMNAISQGMQEGARDQVADYIRNGQTERVTYRKPDAIEAARQNPDYHVQDNEDGSVTVVGVRDSQGNWHGTLPSDPNTEIDTAAHEAATSPHNDLPEPTQAQKEAGNYRKGHIQVHGMDITVENPKGSERRGIRPDGSEWSHTMSDHYGYIKRTTGADGEQVDVYVGPNPESQQVYVVDQLDQQSGGFDEHKVMMGFNSQADAEAAYKSNFDPGWKVGHVSAMDVDGFKTWLKDGDTRKPVKQSTESNQNDLPTTNRIQESDSEQHPQKQPESAGTGTSQTDLPAKPKKTRKPKPVEAETEGVATPISDFGEKIGGAKKDLWKGYSKTLGEELPADEKDITLAKHFPEPDYQQLLDNGVSEKILAAVKAMRDEIPAKPRMAHKAKAWGETVKTLRSFAYDLISERFTLDQLQSQFQASKTLKGFSRLIDVYAEVGYPGFTQLKGIQMERAQFTVFMGVKYPKGINKWVFSPPNKQDSYFDSFDELLEGVRAYAQTMLDTPTEARITQLDIYQLRSTGDIIIGKKVAAGKYIDLKAGFKTSREAREYLAAHNDELLKLLEEKKDVQSERRETNDPRVGEDYRKGENITPEKFANTFGFRGVEFGNYVENAKRQQDLNSTYDALLDMATLLNIPPQAISLNGELGLAFGARGSGGKSPAKAHYESGKVVINLTKNNGAGSLAHEWWHALDNYFSRTRGNSTGFVSDKPKAQRVVKDGRMVEDDSIRPEVLTAWKGVLDAINNSGMVKRSERLDKRRSKDYWSTDIEMTARAFERFIIDSGRINNLSNDYLANIVPEEKYRDTTAYPYPTHEEAQAIGDAYRALFDTLKTKKTDKGTALYSLNTGYKSGISIENTRQILTDRFGEETISKLEQSGKLEIVESLDSLPQDAFNSITAYHGSPYKFDKFSLEHLGRGEGAQLFGYGLYFADNKAVGDFYRKNLSKDGQLYQVDIDADKLLQWELPLSKQAEQEALASIKQQLDDAGLLEHYEELIGRKFDSWTGAILHTVLKNAASNQQLPDNNNLDVMEAQEYQKPDKAVSMYLNSHGIDGIRYLDRGSRDGTTGTVSNNYVIFDDSAIQIVQTYYSQNPGGIEGYHHNGKTVLVASNLTADTVIPTFLHEVGGHAGLQSILPAKTYDALMQQFDAMLKAGNPLAVDAKRRAEVESDPETQRSEYLPYLITVASQAQNMRSGPYRAVQRMIQRIVSAIKAWAIDKLGVNLKVTPDDVVALAERMVKQVASRDSGLPVAESFSRTPWQPDFPDAVVLHRADEVQSHLDYKAAKAGDTAAAGRLVRDVVTDADLAKLKKLVGDTTDLVVAVHAEEQSGRNKIPVAFATLIEQKLGIEADLSIVQAKKVNRGGADGVARLIKTVPFSGNVEAGKRYLLVDDTLTQGGTLASLKGYIEENGGEVVGASTLMGKQYSAKMALQPDTLANLQKIAGKDFEQWWNEALGYSFSELTESEARYLTTLIRKSDANTIRDRLIAEGQAGSDNSTTPAVPGSPVTGKPRFSRQSPPANGPQQASQFDAVSQQALYQWQLRSGQMAKVPKHIGKFLGTMLHKALTNPEFKKPFDLIQAKINHVSVEAYDSLRQAPEVLGHMEDWKDFKREASNLVPKNFKARKTDFAKVSDAVFNGTLNDKKVYSDAELRAMGLNDNQIGIYHDIRNAIDTSLDHYARSVMSKIIQAAGVPMSEIMALHNRDLPVFAHQLELERLADRYAGTDNQDMMANAKERITEVMEKLGKLKEEGYAPLMRFGDHYVKITDPNLQTSDNPDGTVLRQHYESETERDLAAKRLQQSLPAGHQLETGSLNPDDYKMFAGVSPETVALFIKESGLPMDDVTQQYLKLATAQHSALRRLIHRKGIEGFSDDVQRVLAAFVMSNARYSANRLFNDQIDQAVMEVKDGELRRQAQQMKDYALDPKEEMRGVKNFMFLYYMGGSVMFGLINLTQPIMQTFPHLTRYAGGAAFGNIMRGLKQAMQSLKTNTPPATYQADYEKAQREGHLDPQNVWMLQGLERGKAGLANSGWQVFSHAMGYIASVTETINRRATLFAALDTAKKMGAVKLANLGFVSEYDFAIRAIQETQGIYNKGNRPRMARGNVGSLLMMYKQFGIAYIEQMIRATNDPMWAGERDDKRKALLLMLALLFTTAGLTGLPFAKDLMDLVETGTGMAGKPMNLERETQLFLRERMGDEFGQNVADGLMYGPFNFNPIVDIQGRTNMGNQLPGTGAFKMTNDSFETSRQLTEIGGATGGLLQNMYNSMMFLQRGKSEEAMAALAPKAIGDAYKGAKGLATGQLMNERGDKVTDLSMAESLVKVIGGQPARVADEGRTRGYEQKDKQIKNAMSRYFRQRLEDAYNDGGADDVKSVREDIKKWNADNSRYPINIRDSDIKKRVKNSNSTWQERNKTPKGMEWMVDMRPE